MAFAALPTFTNSYGGQTIDGIAVRTDHLKCVGHGRRSGFVSSTDMVSHADRFKVRAAIETLAFIKPLLMWLNRRRDFAHHRDMIP